MIYHWIINCILILLLFISDIDFIIFFIGSSGILCLLSFLNNLASTVCHEAGLFFSGDIFIRHFLRHSWKTSIMVCLFILLLLIWIFITFCILCIIINKYHTTIIWISIFINIFNINLFWIFILLIWYFQNWSLRVSLNFNILSHRHGTFFNMKFRNIIINNQL